MSINRTIERDLLFIPIKNALASDEMDNPSSQPPEQSEQSNCVVEHMDFCQKRPNDLSLDDIQAYWCQFILALTEDRKNRWHWIRYGLNKYLEALKERSKLQKQHDFYVQQNSELGFLMQNYIHSKKFKCPRK